MDRLLFARLPIVRTEREVEALPGKRRTLKPFKAVLEVTITLAWELQEPALRSALPPDTPRLLALLETGHNHMFSVREDQMLNSGVPRPLWPRGGSMLEVTDASGATFQVERLQIDVWLHSDQPEWKNQPYRIRLKDHGAALFATRRGTRKPRGPDLPILGVAALCAGRIRADYDCHEDGGEVHIWVPATHRAAHPRRLRAVSAASPTVSAPIPPPE